jgi:hypothetical protein
MPIESLCQCGLLLAAVVVAFATSFAVGMLIERPWASSRPLGGASDD